MSTRCQVILKDSNGEVWFYRHSDGYPEGVKETLDKFCAMVNNGKIRDNVTQASGWLVVLGREEYAPYEEHDKSGFMGWKVGAYEPCPPREFGDIDYLYTVDLTKPKVKWTKKKKRD